MLPREMVLTRGVTLNIDKKNEKRQIIAPLILMKYENANPWFCSKCSPSLAGRLWSCNFSVLLKGQIFWLICLVFPAFFAAILLLYVGRLFYYGYFIIPMTFCEQKLDKIVRKRKNRNILDVSNLKIFKYFTWFSTNCFRKL